MTRKGTLIPVVVLIAFSFAVQSCRKTPYPCYTTSVNIDSIRVNIPVTFNASCSSYANGYNWQITSLDSTYIAFTPAVTITFNDTGNVDVYLLVTNGNQPNSSDQTIHVSQ